MKNLELTPKTKSEIEKLVSLECIKRGFPSVNYTYFGLESEEFQTTPVIFKYIKLKSWSFRTSEYKPTPEVSSDVTAIDVDIQMNVSYKHFDGGCNSCELFSIHLRVLENKENYTDVRVISVK